MTEIVVRETDRNHCDSSKMKKIALTAKKLTEIAVTVQKMTPALTAFETHQKEIRVSDSLFRDLPALFACASHFVLFYFIHCLYFTVN